MENFKVVNGILSPLDQFEVRNLFSLDAPVLGDLHLFLTNVTYILIVLLLLIAIAVILVKLIFICSNSHKFRAFYIKTINYVFSIGISKLLPRVVAILFASYIKLCLGDPTLYHEIVCWTGIYWLSCEVLTELFSLITPSINLGQLLFGLNFSGLPGFGDIFKADAASNPGSGTASGSGGNPSGNSGGNNPGGNPGGNLGGNSGGNNPGGNAGGNPGGGEGNVGSSDIAFRGNGFDFTTHRHYIIHGGDPGYNHNGSNQPFATNLANALDHARKSNAIVMTGDFHPHVRTPTHIFGANGARFLEEYHMYFNVQANRNAGPHMFYHTSGIANLLRMLQ